jgi:hypothetical protein
VPYNIHISSYFMFCSHFSVDFRNRNLELGKKLNGRSEKKKKCICILRGLLHTCVVLPEYCVCGLQWNRRWLSYRPPRHRRCRFAFEFSLNSESMLDFVEPYSRNECIVGISVSTHIVEIMQMFINFMFSLHLHVMGMSQL